MPRGKSRSGQIIPKLREGEMELVRGNQRKTVIHAGSRCWVLGPVMLNPFYVTGEQCYV